MSQMKRPTHKNFIWSYGFCVLLASGLVRYWLLGYEGGSLAETIAATVLSVLAGLCILQVVVAAIIVEVGQRNRDLPFTVVRRIASIGSWSYRTDQDKNVS